MKFSKLVIIALFGLSSFAANAGVIFTFADDGGNLTMTSSGTLDTTKLVQQGSASTWGGAGFGNFGSYSMIGGTTVGQVDISFGFNAGTDFTPWLAGSSAFTANHFNSVVSGTKGFATYLVPFPYTPGISMESADIVGGMWTPDQSWTFVGGSIAAYGLVAGTYTVADAVTSESITFQVGAVTVPEPGALSLLGLGLAGLGFLRRRKVA